MAESAGSIDDIVAGVLADHAGEERSTLVAVAVSGGVDSVVAAHAVRSAGYPVALLHVHHGLRGGDADRDADLVVALAEAWDCPVSVRRIGQDLAGVPGSESLQGAARSLRYAALEKSCLELGATWLVTGHNRDDQAETVLLQLVRGTGPDGLAGMPVMRPVAPGSPVRLLRPLLRVDRASITAYAVERGVVWREDASNEAESYLRNAIRRRVLPLLDEVAGGRTADRIARAADRLRHYRESELDPLTDALLAGAVRTLPSGGVLVSDAVLDPLPDVWRGRLVLRALERSLPDADRTEATVRRATDLLASQTGRCVPLDGGSVWREREGLAFVPDRPVPEPAKLSPGIPVEWGGQVIRLDHGPGGEGIALDPERLTGPLVVRAWKPGDRIRPAGMNGSRKVKDILTDARIPAHARSHAPVVTCGEDVVWVVGVRADRRFMAESVDGAVRLTVHQRP